jgi:hypothetical protein
VSKKTLAWSIVIKYVQDVDQTEKYTRLEMNTHWWRAWRYQMKKFACWIAMNATGHIIQSLAISLYSTK